MRFPGIVIVLPAVYPVPALARLILMLALPTVNAISSAVVLPPIVLPRIFIASPEVYPLPASVWFILTFAAPIVKIRSAPPPIDDPEILSEIKEDLIKHKILKNA